MSTFAAMLFAALIPFGTTNGADPLSRYDELIISAEVQNECHFEISGSLSEEKLNVIGNAARGEMFKHVYDKTASTKENWSKINKMMFKRTQDDKVQGKELVTARGCEDLIPHAREVLKPYH
jgi:hypothetical protein